MPSGSKKDDYKPDQYARQLEHSRAWKARNAEAVKVYNRRYNQRRRQDERPLPLQASDNPE